MFNHHRVWDNKAPTLITDLGGGMRPGGGAQIIPRGLLQPPYSVGPAEGGEIRRVGRREVDGEMRLGVETTVGRRRAWSSTWRELVDIGGSAALTWATNDWQITMMGVNDAPRVWWKGNEVDDLSEHVLLPSVSSYLYVFPLDNQLVFVPGNIYRRFSYNSDTNDVWRCGGYVFSRDETKYRDSENNISTLHFIDGVSSNKKFPINGLDKFNRPEIPIIGGGGQNDYLSTDLHCGRGTYINGRWHFLVEIYKNYQIGRIINWSDGSDIHAAIIVNHRIYYELYRDSYFCIASIGGDGMKISSLIGNRLWTIKYSVHDSGTVCGIPTQDYRRDVFEIVRNGWSPWTSSLTARPTPSGLEYYLISVPFSDDDTLSSITPHLVRVSEDGRATAITAVTEFIGFSPYDCGCVWHPNDRDAIYFAKSGSPVCRADLNTGIVRQLESVPFDLYTLQM